MKDRTTTGMQAARRPVANFLQLRPERLVRTCARGKCLSVTVCLGSHMANLCRLVGHSPSVRRSTLTGGGEWQSQCRWCGSAMVKYWGRKWHVTDGRTAVLSLPDPGADKPIFAWNSPPATTLRKMPPWGGDLIGQDDAAGLVRAGPATQRHPH